MRLAFFGDVMGRSGREGLMDELPQLADDHGFDFIIVNAENAAGGFGITGAIAQNLFAVGVDVITTGNHAFDQKDEMSFFDVEPRLLRPANFPKGNPGRGAGLYETTDGRSVLVIHLHGQRFMAPMDDMVPALERELEGVLLGREADAIVVDVHAEASSEKYVIGQYLDGRVTAVVGSHTHVPTADAQVLPQGTAFHSDAGMCGDYDSVIGMEKRIPIDNMVTKIRTGRLTPAGGEATLCATIVDVDPHTGLAVGVYPLRHKGRLAPALPPAKPVL